MIIITHHRVQCRRQNEKQKQNSFWSWKFSFLLRSRLCWNTGENSNYSIDYISKYLYSLVLMNLENLLFTMYEIKIFLVRTIFHVYISNQSYLGTYKLNEKVFYFPLIIYIDLIILRAIFVKAAHLQPLRSAFCNLPSHVMCLVMCIVYIVLYMFILTFTFIVLLS